MALALTLICSVACVACSSGTGSSSDDSASTGGGTTPVEHTHEFDGIVITTKPSKLTYTALEAFDMIGIAVTKHCVADDCDGEAVTGGVTFAYEKEGATCLTGDMTKVIIKADGFEADLAVTVNKIEVDLPTIDGKAYTGETLTATVPESELYTVTENNGGTAIGEYDVVLTLADPVNYKFKNESGATATVKFEITKTFNTVTLNAIDSIHCGETPVLSATALEDAQITYLYATAEDGTYGESIEGGFVAGTYYVKARSAETDSYAVTESDPKSFTVEHAFSSWQEGTDEDVALCSCGHALDEKFSKKVTLDRQDVILSADAPAIALTGVSEYASVKSIKYGEIDLGTDIAKLTKSEDLTNAVHGEQNLTVTVTDSHGLDHVVTVPVTIVTQSFASVTDIINTITYKNGFSGKTHEGKYYILAGDISYSGNYTRLDDSNNATNAQGNGNGFAGTFDGRNHTISGGNMYGGGLFGSLCGATVKNLKFKQVNIEGANRTLIAASIWHSKLENIEIGTYGKNVSDPGYYFGIFASGHCIGATFKDITIDLRDSKIPWLFGKGYGNADAGNLTFENVNVKAASVEYVAANSNNDSKLYFGDASGINFTFSGTTITASDETVIDPKETSFYFDVAANPWTKFETLKTITLDYKGVQTDITEYAERLVDDSANGIGLTDLCEYITEDMYNEKVTLKIEFDVGASSVAKVDYEFEVGDVNVPVTLTTRQDIILADSEGDKTTFTLDLGEYGGEGYTLTKVAYGGAELAMAGGVITVSDTMKNGTHGETSVSAIVTKGNTVYTVSVPVTIITETFSSVPRIIAVVGYKDSDSGKKLEGKYYTLAGNISFSDNYSGNTTQKGLGNGFAGTFDGRGFTITGGNMWGGGLFGSLEGATIKNLKFAQINPRGINGTLISGSVFNSTLENIEISTKSMTITGSGYFGVIASHRVVNLTMKDVTVDMGESEIPWVLGQGWANHDSGQYHCTNVVIKLKSLDCLACDSNSANTSPKLAKDGVSGLTVIESGATTDGE